MCRGVLCFQPWFLVVASLGRAEPYLAGAGGWQAELLSLLTARQPLPWKGSPLFNTVASHVRPQAGTKLLSACKTCHLPTRYGQCNA